MKISGPCRCSDHSRIKPIPPLWIWPALLFRRQHKLGMALQQAMNLIGVLGRMHSAGGIHDAAAGLEQRQQSVEKTGLKLNQIRNRSLGDAPARIRMTGQGAQT